MSPAHRRPAELAGKGAAVGAGIGAPLGVVVVYLLDTYAFPEPMPAYVAAAVGSLVAALATWFAQRRER